MSSLWERIKETIANIFRTRIIILIVIFCGLFAVLLGRVFNLQIVKGETYVDDYKLQIQKTKTVQGTRGNIYDRNGKLLAYNELAYSVTIEDNGDYDTRAQKNRELNKVITTVIKLVEKNGDAVINDFGIVLDADNNYQFTATSDTQRLRFIADVYGKKKTDELSSKQKQQSAADIINYLCTDDQYGYGINNKKLDKAAVLKLINIRYSIALHSFSKYIETTIAEDVSQETVADIMEELHELQGVDIKEDSMRRYNDPQAFASLVGYTGHISQEEYNALDKKDQETYTLTDTIGKSGLEQTMDSYLQGEKGEIKLYVNNVGKVIDTEKGTDAKAGNDVYLTIDADLQKATYHLIEQELAGIVLSRMQNVLDYDASRAADRSDIIIPVGDAYNSLVSNDILSIRHFSDPQAKTTEKAVNTAFTAQKQKVLEQLRQTLENAGAPAYKDSSKEYQAYCSYLVNDLLTSTYQVIDSARVDKEDETYKAWREDESINIYSYLNYAISKNWVNTANLQVDEKTTQKYTDSSETYHKLVDFIMEKLANNNGFDKLIYQYMIKSGAVTGRQLCLILYEQGVLKADENQYERLDSGAVSAYDFLRGKLQTLEITPGQLALEPCTGSMVVTDPKSGAVLACVSYPGYDNNRLANTMDSDYYNKLLTDQSRPFYNNATQETTAPGSTYKPLTAIAGLTEGVITTNSTINCTGIFEKVEPNPKCWIYPSGHGSETVATAIRDSCNMFFYEVGYRLSLKDASAEAGDDAKGTATKKLYSSSLGTDRLKKYATLFGLNQKSGVEIPETAPNVSDESSVPSAIGQGTNNYTTAQLARYVTTVANEGTVYDLSLLSKVTDLNGKTVKEYQPEVVRQISEVAQTSWDAVHTGMRNVVAVTYPKVFNVLGNNGLKISGKSGTAQQSTSHPSHALFIGYAPSDDPQIAFSVRIANGYTSLYAAEVARDVMKYYYKIGDPAELITGHANELSSTSSSQTD